MASQSNHVPRIISFSPSKIHNPLDLMEALSGLIPDSVNLNECFVQILVPFELYRHAITMMDEISQFGGFAAQSHLNIELVVFRKGAYTGDETLDAFLGQGLCSLRLCEKCFCAYPMDSVLLRQDLRVISRDGEDYVNQHEYGTASHWQLGKRIFLEDLLIVSAGIVLVSACLVGLAFLIRDALIVFLFAVSALITLYLCLRPFLVRIYFLLKYADSDVFLDDKRKRDSTSPFLVLCDLPQKLSGADIFSLVSKCLTDNFESLPDYEYGFLVCGRDYGLNKLVAKELRHAIRHKACTALEVTALNYVESRRVGSLPAPGSVRIVLTFLKK